MADDAPLIRFHRPTQRDQAPARELRLVPTAAAPTIHRESEGFQIYDLSLQLATDIFTVIELVAGVERFYVRDQLDRKSTGIPQLVRQGLSTHHMTERRRLYHRARQMTVECLATLDILAARGSIEPEAVGAARNTATALIDALRPLLVTPTQTR